MKNQYLLIFMVFMAFLVLFLTEACTDTIATSPLKGSLNDSSTQNETKYVLWQTKAEGSTVEIIDIEEQSIIKSLKVGPNPHGIAYSESTNTVYISLEYNAADHGEVIWVNADTYEIVKRVDVGLEPHEIEVTPDGAFIYVPCRDGHYWVLNAKDGKVIKKIYTGGRPHNTRVSKNGKYMFLSPMGAPEKVTIVDVKNEHSVIGKIKFSNSVRPSAISDSLGLFFQHVDGLNGFEVADINKQKLTHRVEHQHRLGWFKILDKLGWLGPNGFNRCHGLEVRPDEKEIWSVCGNLLRIHELNKDLFEEIYSIQLPAKAYWLTFSPDNTYAIIALSNKEKILVMDVKNKKELTQISVCCQPKRNLVLLKQL